ncbi:hypothetical protein AB7C87_12345 [Natrarchaeobius sp. A-rgal3]|uniref:hypothetical protein n=1 Tax=Natrarchaeobius versutus TaxID=1679078 RepID=UPI00350FE729
MPLKPRIVLVLVLGASLAGTWTVGTRSGNGPAIVLLEWTALLGLGAAIGGIGWRLALYSRGVLDENCVAFVDRRYALIELCAVGGALAGIGAIAAGRSVELGPRVGVATGVLVVAYCAISVALALARIDSPLRERSWRAVALALGCLAVALVGTVNVLSLGGGALEVAVRIVHLSAFSVWFGGALWHNLIVVGAVRRYPGSKSEITAQTRAFRRTVPALVVALVLTGVAQSITAFGTSSSVYVGTVPGLLICLKVGIALVVTFFLVNG